MPDFNADKEHGQGDIVYAVRNAHKGIPIKSLQTGKGELKLDKKGRCIVKDAALAAEIRKEYPHDLAVSRLFTNHPSDRGHRYVFGQMPGLPFAKYDELGRRIRDTEPTESREEAQDEKPAEEKDKEV